jgi:signal transduction histidine kinase
VVCALISIAAGWTSYAERLNGSFYDLYFRQRGPLAPHQDIVLVAIDDETLARFGALPLDRSVLAQGIRAIQEAGPRLLAVDLLLSDVAEPSTDAELQAALDGPAPVVLATALEANTSGRWLHPLPSFAGRAAVGHVHAAPDADGVSRRVLLEKQSGRERYWAMALECVRIWFGAAGEPITETDEALEVPRSADRGNLLRVRAPRGGERALLVNYAGGNGTFPQIGFARLLSRPELRQQLRDKAVLLGVTAQGAGDRLFVPFSSGIGMPGVEIHANLLHTLLTEQYLRPAGELAVVFAALAIAGITAWAFARFQGFRLGILLSGVGLAVIALPYRLFLAGQVWPAFSLLLPFGVTATLGGAFQLLLARWRLDESEAKRQRSQQQWQMAAHEIRTPLTAIQGSSELLLRYPLDDAKRAQMVRLISEESGRLGKLVERFLSVERLSAGELELRRVPLDLAALLAATAERVRLTAERKGIRLIYTGELSGAEIEGDPELLEFAISNLLTNAVKYSPAGTSVTLALERSGDQALLHVSDQGPGMTPEESRRIFDRFYRTESAQGSEHPGFGLGLAIAREIANHHGGDLRVESTPGAGSRFTLALPVRIAHKQVEIHRRS